MNGDDMAAIASAMQAAWTQAFAARDLAALAALYSPNVQFWGSTAELYLSRDGVREYFSTLPPSYKRSVYRQPNVLRIGPDAFCASGEVIFVCEDDGHAVERPYRMTQVFVRDGERWSIALHHASPVPG